MYTQCTIYSVHYIMLLVCECRNFATIHTCVYTLTGSIDTTSSPGDYTHVREYIHGSRLISIVPDCSRLFWMISVRTRLCERVHASAYNVLQMRVRLSYTAMPRPRVRPTLPCSLPRPSATTSGITS